MSGTGVRPYDAGDRDELLAVFRRAGEGSPTETLWGDDASEAAIYLTPYLDHEPESVFIAVMDGAIVGYLAGSLGAGAVPSEGDRMVRAIREHRVFRRRRALAFFARSSLDGIAALIGRQPTAGELDDPRWPAHLHINVERGARGTGLAYDLMTAWQDHVRAAGVTGSYLQTLVENTRAVRFFTRCGFVPYGETPAVPGLRFEGQRVYQQTMVWPGPSEHRGSDAHEEQAREDQAQE